MARASVQRRYGLLGAPSSAGANNPGLEQGPDHLRRAGLALHLVVGGATIVDYGDCPQRCYRPDAKDRSARNLAEVVAAARDVERAVSAIVKHGDLPIVLGGDCTVTLGAVAALVPTRGRLGLLYLDSQTDLNTPETTDTGILDSMGLAHMIGCADNTLSRLGAVYPLMDARRVVAFGFHPERITPAEHDVLSAHPIVRFPATEVTGSAKERAAVALTQLEHCCDAFVLHFDVDVIDFADFPVADAPVYRGHGLTFSESMEALRVFVTSPKLALLAITEFNPDRDKDGALSRVFARCVANALTGKESADGYVRC